MTKYCSFSQDYSTKIVYKDKCQENNIRILIHINQNSGIVCMTADDNPFEISLGLFTVQDEDACCHIYVMPFEAPGDFLYPMADELL